MNAIRMHPAKFALSIMLILLISIVPTSVLADSGDDSEELPNVSTSPIRDSDRTLYPMDVTVEYRAGWVTWSHSIDDKMMEMADDTHDWYFYISEDRLGSTIFAELDIVDLFWGIEPDLDLYLYGPDGTMLDYSAQLYDVNESVQVIAEEVGYYRLEVDRYEQDGPYDLYREVRHNRAPEAHFEVFPFEEPVIHELFVVSACDSFDWEDRHDVDFLWVIDGQPFDAEDEFGEPSCYIEMRLHDTFRHEVEVTVTDEYGLYDTDSVFIYAQGYPSDLSSLSVGEQYSFDTEHDSIFELSQNSSRYEVTSLGLWFSFGISYNVVISHSGSVFYNNSIEAIDEDSWIVFQELSSSSSDYEVLFKPELVFSYFIEEHGKWEELRLPMPSMSPVYQGEPSFGFGDKVIYYWDDYVELPLADTGDGMDFYLTDEIVLSSIDLYPFVEKLMENYLKAQFGILGNLFMALFSTFVNITIPLNYSLSVTSFGLHFIDIISVANGGEFNDAGGSPFFGSSETTYWESNPVGNDTVNYDHEVGLDITSAENSEWLDDLANQSSSVTLNAVSNHVEFSSYPVLYSYMRAQVQPFISIAFTINNHTVFDTQIASFSSSEAWEMTVTELGLIYQWEWWADTDGDGVTDNLETCPLTDVGWDVDENGCAAYQRDTDGDGVNDHLEQCSGTRVGENVNEVGCALYQLDSDSDGVSDDVDICGNTSTQNNINSAGCSAMQRDTDGDGIFDANDSCVESPGGEPINDEGCANSELPALSREFKVAGAGIVVWQIASLFSVLIILLLCVVAIGLRRRRDTGEVPLSTAYQGAAPLTTPATHIPQQHALESQLQPTAVQPMTGMTLAPAGLPDNPPAPLLPEEPVGHPTVVGREASHLQPTASAPSIQPPVPQPVVQTPPRTVPDWSGLPGGGSYTQQPDGTTAYVDTTGIQWSQYPDGSWIENRN